MKNTQYLSINNLFLVVAISLFALSLNSCTTPPNSKNQVVRVATIDVDSVQLDSYKAALKEGIETAVKTEAGVLSLYAASDKDNPTRITVFEVYADTNAYKTHIETPHFKKYKNTVKDMVKSLKLTDVVPVALESK